MNAVVIAVAAVWAGVGAFLVIRHRNPLGIAAMVGGVASAAALAAPGVVALVPAAALHLAVTVPDGRFARRGHRMLVMVSYAVGAVVAIAMSTRSDPPWWPPAVEALLALAVGVPISNNRYRRSAGVDRQRLQWVGCAVAVGGEVALVAVALRVLADWPHGLGAVFVAATVTLPMALLAGTSPRLVGGVDRLLTHTVSAAGLTGVVVAVYVVIVVGLGRVPTHQERTLLGLSMAAAAVAVLLYVPARRRLADFSNRIAYGEREAPDETLRTFGTRLSRAIPMDELLLQLAESLRKTFTLTSAEVWTGSDGVLDRAVSVPERGPRRITIGATEAPVVARAGVTGPAWLKVWLPALLEGREDASVRMAPVAHQGELLGMLVAERPAGGDAYSEDDERVLSELARQVGLALHNVQLDSALQASLDEVRRQAEELRASRARVVAAGDEQRRKIERNLHDGAQQHLVALAVNLRLARTVARSDPAAADELLQQLGEDVQATLEELRTLAHGIYPPLLMDRGLGDALRAAAGRSVLPTEVEDADVGRFNPDTEAAVYFCCLEALQNAGKHAGEGAKATIKVWQEDDHLHFSVTDTGAGFDLAAYGAGAGFVNMSDRVGAVGGTVRVDSAPGSGTRIEGSIPV
jgi:signal transduction histidine kinase